MKKFPINDVSTPVVVLNCKLGALSIMRSLGVNGIRMIGVDENPQAPGLLSRYCSQSFLHSLDPSRQENLLQFLIELAGKLGQRAVLIPTSDDTSVFTARFRDELARHYAFQDNSLWLVENLASKEGMFKLARKNDFPTPFTVFPKNLQEVEQYSRETRYPVMLKGIDGNRLERRTGKKMVLVENPDELLQEYALLEDPHDPNLMIQEYIPGGDDQVFIFNGYFDKNSDCLVGFTGFKVRQFPVHVGCAALGECSWISQVADQTIHFMKQVGYQGIVDIGYRLDPRDGVYKVLDINPRVGQAFRLFLAENEMDVIRALYLDLTGQQVPKSVSREKRRWAIEDFDLVSSLHYHWEGNLSFYQWLKSFKGLEETLWFDWKDLRPFNRMLRGLLQKILIWVGKKLHLISEEKKTSMPAAGKQITRANSVTEFQN